MNTSESLSRAELQARAREREQALQASLVTTIAGLLTGLEPGDRRAVMGAALAKAEGDKKYLVPWMSGIPGSMSAAEARRVINGLGARILAMAVSNPSDSIQDLEQRAASMVTGQPYAGDPAAAADNGLPLARALLTAIILQNDEATKVAAQDPEIQNGLRAILARAAEPEGAQSPAANSGRVVDVISVSSPLAGSFWDELWGALKNAAPTLTSALGKGISTAADEKRIADALSQQATAQGGESSVADASAPGAVGLVAQGTQPRVVLPIGQSVEDAITKLTTPGLVYVNWGIGSDPAQAMSKTMSLMKAQLQEAVAQMQAASSSYATMRRTAEDAVRDMTRITWASAALEASDEAAQVMELVKPDYSSAKQLLSTVWDLVPAAKQTGDLSLWSALVGSVRSAISKGNLPQSALSALGLLSGDAELADEEDSADVRFQLESNVRVGAELEEWRDLS